MDNRLTPEQKDALIERALHDIPLAPMPRDITANIMARIQVDKRPTLATWNDFAIAFTIALCVGALFFAAQNLPPIILAKIRIQGILFYQDLIVNARWLVPAVLFGAAAFFSALTIPYLRRELSK
ncbi:MAG: hypothetical protein IH588_03640 [Anaerolineales bacterium]|nr:hypothetical protein [Anaerolineales bacterium]